MSNVATLKENAQAQRPLVLFTITFSDGTIKRYCTHAVTFGGHSYTAQVLKHSFIDIQAQNEQGIDLIPSMSLTLANADTTMTQLNASKGFLGATILAIAVIGAFAGGESDSSDSWTLFSGQLSAPTETTDVDLSLSAINGLSLAKNQLPPARIQRRCFNLFPATLAQRTAGASDFDSLFSLCGYSADVPLVPGVHPAGRLNSGVAFTTCQYTRADCVARGMFWTDATTTLASNAALHATSISVNADIVNVGESVLIGGQPDPASGGFTATDSRVVTAKSGSGPYTYTVASLSHAHSGGTNVGIPTGRYSGMDFLPSVIQVRAYGASKAASSNVQGAQYNDPIPMVYGVGWVPAPVVALRNDGNLTRMQVLVSLGQTYSANVGAWQVLVNGTFIPLSTGAGQAPTSTGNDPTASGWWSIINDGTREGEFDQNFTDTAGNPLGNPYGNVTYLSVVVPTKLADGSSTPQVRVFCYGRMIETFDSGGSSLGVSWSNNTAWVLLDILKVANFGLQNINLPSAYAVAQKCAASITQTDDNGNSISGPRFMCNLVIDKFRRTSDIVLGVRRNARIYFTYDSAGKLYFNIEDTIANQQPTKPYGSNATATINGGYPAYVYDDSSIIRDQNGRSTLRSYSRTIQDTPDVLTMEFQDQWNQYVQDSVTISDTGQQAITGYTVPDNPAVDGLPGYDQATRAGSFLDAKNIPGNLFTEFMTSVKGLGQQVGQIIAITQTKQSWSNKLFRIIKLAPMQNARQFKITAQTHDDAWYDDTYGQITAPSGRIQFSSLAAARPICGSAPVSEPPTNSDSTDTQYGRFESVNGSQLNLSVFAAGPTQQLSTKTGIPLVNPQATVATTGGSLPGGVTLYYGLAAKDASLYQSPISAIITAVIPAGTNTNKVTITGISIDSGATDLVLYRGRTPLTLVSLGNASGISGSTISDTGVAAAPEMPVDPNFDHANFYWRTLQQLSMGPVTADLANSDSTHIGAATLAMPTNAFAGRFLEIVDGGASRTQKRIVVSNTATSLTVSPAWTFNPDATSVFVVYDQVTSVSGAVVTDAALTLVANAYIGSVMKIMSGTGAGQEAIIASNTTGGAFTLTAPFFFPPDTTSSFAIMGSNWTFGGSGSPPSTFSEYTALVGTFPIPNSPGAIIELLAVPAKSDETEFDLLGVEQRYVIVGSSAIPYANSSYVLSVPGILGIESTATPPRQVSSSSSGRTCRALVNGAPTGAAITVLVKRNGATYATLSIGAGTTTSSPVSGAPLTAGDVITIDITGVGTTFAGQDLTVSL